MNSQQELKILEEIENIPSRPKWNIFLCVDEAVNVPEDFKIYLEAHYIKTKDKMPKKRFLEVCNYIDFPVRFFEMMSAKKLIQFKNEQGN
jgi:hypothetical protein